MIKTTIIFILILFTVNVYSQNSFEFHGKINVDGGKRQGIKIVVTKDGKPFKTFRPENSGKYSFFLDYNSNYIISYEKAGFVSKKVEINTNVPDKVLADNKFRYKWKTDVNLFKEYEGIDFSFFKDPIQKIYFDENSSRFDYDNRYAKKIEKELKAKMKEIEERKAEEIRKAEAARQKAIRDSIKAERAKQAALLAEKKRKAEEARKAEEEKKRKEAARQKAIRDSIKAERAKQAALLAEQKRLKKERERLLAEKKRKEEEARAAQLLAAKKAAEEEQKRKEEERRKKQEELIQKRKEEAKRKEEERLERERKLKEEAEKARAKREAEKAALKAKLEAARLAAIEANKKNKVQEIFTDNYKKVIRITVTQGKKINIYKKVQWNWGGVYYFKNDKNISRSLFYKETK